MNHNMAAQTTDLAQLGVKIREIAAHIERRLAIDVTQIQRPPLDLGDALEGPLKPHVIHYMDDAVYITRDICTTMLETADNSMNRNWELFVLMDITLIKLLAESGRFLESKKDLEDIVFWGKSGVDACHPNHKVRLGYECNLSSIYFEVRY